MQGSIDGLYAYTHPFGCSQTGDDHAQTRKLLASLTKHPNAGAVLVLCLGCENLTKEQFIAELGEYDTDRIRFSPGLPPDCYPYWIYLHLAHKSLPYRLPVQN